MYEAMHTPLGKYPETVTYTLGKIAGANNSNLPVGNTYENNAYTRYLKKVLNIKNADVFEFIDELFMEDVSDMMDEDLFDAGVLDSMGTVELIVELESRFDIRVPVSEFGRDDWNTANKIVEGVTELRNA